MRKGKKIISVLLLFAMLCSLLGCTAQKQDEISTTGFAFDTTYTITLYEGGSQNVLNACVQKCSAYEKVFSRTLEESELYQVNEIESLYLEAVTSNTVWKKAWGKGNATYSEKMVSDLTRQINGNKGEKNKADFCIQRDGSIIFQISGELGNILRKGIAYSQNSQGAFDLAIEPITSLWNFSEGENNVPNKKEIEEALAYVDYRKLSLRGGSLTFKMPGMGIDLGGIAKGYIADELADYLQSQGVKRAVINLGGNVLCVGKKSDKKNFAIGIQQPFADRNETVAAVSIDGMSVVSSGIYERYFKDEKGKIYHHIINPKTGYSYENDLLAVTIISKKSVDGDALSTTCFSMGKEQGLAYLNSLSDVCGMFITKDEKQWYSDGFKEFLIKE